MLNGRAPAVARRLRRASLWAWASLAIIAIEGLVALLAGPQPFLVAGMILVAPGLAVVAFLPAELTAPVVRFAVVPVLGAAISSVVIISASSAGIPLSGTSVRLLLIAVTLGSLAVQIKLGPSATTPGLLADPSAEVVGLLLLGAVVGLGITLQALIVGGVPVPGQDWGHYLLYTDEIRRTHSLTIDNPYWMLGGRPFGEDPGVPSLYAGYGLVSGQPTAVLVQGIWVFAALAVVSVFMFAASLWGRTAGLIAAGIYAAIPMNLDMLAWHGLANVYALVVFPLVLTGAGMVLRGEVGRRWSAVLALGLVTLVAAHRLTFLIALLTLILCFALSAWLRFRPTLRFALWTLALAAVLGVGVLVDVARRTAASKGIQDYRAYLDTKVVWSYVSRDLTTLLCVLGVLALVVVLAARPRRRDPARLVLVCLLATVLALSYGWVVHFPTDYTRPVYYLPLVVSSAIGIAWAWAFPRFVFAAVAVIAVAAFQSWNLAPTLRSYYGFVNRDSLAGLDYLETRTRPGTTIVTDACWGFLSTWLLREPTLAGQAPSMILPRWEVEPAAVARRVLQGGEPGLRLARRMDVRYALIDPLCTGQQVAPPSIGKTIFASNRLVVLDLGTTTPSLRRLQERSESRPNSAGS
jgi:hypothetical protein